MGRIWVRELTGGLDTRRMPATTPGGVLIKGEDGHINSGGEFEKRPAFVPRYSLPAGTVSMAYTTAGLLVFGHTTAPALPSGVSYQQLVHPSNPAIALVRVLSFDLYGGKVYAVGLFADGSVYHYYDGANVTDWFDGRARASFRITGGSVAPATHAAGSFEVTDGASGAGNEITSVKIDGVDILTGPIAHTGNNSTTASAVAAAINSLTSSPDYSATATGQTVNIQAAATGTAANGKAVIVDVGGTAAVGNIVNMAGGAAATTSTLTSLLVNGVAVTSAPVQWATSNEATAAAIASAINSFTSVPDYDATAVGETVNIIAATAGTAPNGFVVSINTANGLTVDPGSGLVMSGGVDSTAFVPGKFVKTIGSKEYSVSDGTLHFSGIRAPTKWTTDTTGAGFINMSQETSNAEELVAVANYQGFIAVFAPRVVLIYYVDPDPDLNSKSQILRNTGTNYPGSVTEFGDSDLFYLAESGCRSLKARDSSNAASTTDIGVPVDTLVRAKLRAMTPDERTYIQGLINPSDGRFWLIMGDTVFVFSFFPNSKVSAWTTYKAGTLNGEVATSFEIENAVVFGDTVYVRSGDTIYAFGGDGDEEVYDDTVAKAHLPFLSADKPTEFKGWNGIDCAVEGNWKLYAAPVLNNVTVRELVATATETTYDKQRHPYQGQSTHVSMQFESYGPGRAVLSSALLHYVGGEDN
ncbi:Flagellar hook-length control protein FliK [Devosia sp. H5989]|nr:Flagellar hook-length control protein FliK [Devosia sp. H5989]